MFWNERRHNEITELQRESNRLLEHLATLHARDEHRYGPVLERTERHQIEQGKATLELLQALRTNTDQQADALGAMVTIVRQLQGRLNRLDAYLAKQVPGYYDPATDYRPTPEEVSPNGT
jgi:hypothetical protein